VKERAFKDRVSRTGQKMLRRRSQRTRGEEEYKNSSKNKKDDKKTRRSSDFQPVTTDCTRLQHNQLTECREEVDGAHGDVTRLIISIRDSIVITLRDVWKIDLPNPKKSRRSVGRLYTCAQTYNSPPSCTWCLGFPTPASASQRERTSCPHTCEPV
jgi:hypothetical protein